MGLDAIISLAGLIGVALVVIGIYLTAKTMGSQPDIKLRGARYPVLIVVYAAGIVTLYQIGAFSGLIQGTQATADITTPPAGVQGQPVTTPQGVNQVSTGTERTELVNGKQCVIQSDGTNNIDLAVRNKENSSLGYLGISVSANEGATTLSTGTTTDGASLSYASLSVTPCKDITIYGLATSGVGVASFTSKTDSFATTKQIETEGAAQNVVNVVAYDRNGNKASSGLTNGSVGSETGSGYAISGASTTDGNAYYTNTTLSSGGSISNFKLEYAVNGTTTVFGAYGASDGTIYSYDSTDAAIFSSNSLTLSDSGMVGLKELSSCPATITANRNAEKCWTARTLKATDGVVEIRGSLKADLNNPTETGDNPKLCIDDKVYFRDTNGQIAYDYFSSAGANQGAAGVCMNFVVS